MPWRTLLVGLALVLAVAAIGVAIWWRRSATTRAAAVAHAKSVGVDLVKLPGRLRRLAADPRTPRRARWWLIALAAYVASPIDPIPDFIPGIGHLNELVIVPLVLRHVRRIIPANVWAEHFPPRQHPAKQRADPE